MLDERLTVLRAIDKFDRLGVEGRSRNLLGEGRKDESGDFTKGAGLLELSDQIQTVAFVARCDPDYSTEMFLG